MHADAGNEETELRRPERQAHSREKTGKDRGRWGALDVRGELFIYTARAEGEETDVGGSGCTARGWERACVSEIGWGIFTAPKPAGTTWQPTDTPLVSAGRHGGSADIQMPLSTNFSIEFLTSFIHSLVSVNRIPLMFLLCTPSPSVCVVCRNRLVARRRDPTRGPCPNQM